MADFIRARSDEQKQQRMAEIKAATDELFSTQPYHEITLTTIAEKLGWSRANLYKYVSTKEEISLSLAADKRDAYNEAFLAAYPEDCGYSLEVLAQVWAGILNSHRSHLHYGDLLMRIIETNVSLDCLVEFKRGYYEGIDKISDRLTKNLGLTTQESKRLFETVYQHAVSVNSVCTNNPLAKQALGIIGIDYEATRPNFLDDMKDFILMCLQWYTGKAS